MSARQGRDVRDVARAFLAGGARLLQLRAKHAASGLLLEWAEAIVALAGPYGAEVIVNDRADIARLAGAAGVHVGQDDLSPGAVRRLLGPSAVIGLSTHTREQIAAAAGEPISYIAVGPIFATATKDTGHAPAGLDLVRRGAVTGKPVVAIGGITLENARSVLDAGATAVAVIHDLMATGDPEGRLREWVRRHS